MKNKQVEAQLQDSIDAFVAEINELVRQAAIQAVSDALGNREVVGSVRAGRAVRGAPAQRTTRKRIRRSAQMLEEVSGKILTYVNSHPGARMEDLSKSLRIETKDLRGPLQLLLTGKKLKTKGQKRGTKYFVSSTAAAKVAARRRPSKKR